MKSRLPLILPLSLTILFPLLANAGWKRLSESDVRSYPKNLARMHMGAQLLGEENAVLLSSDVTDSNRSPKALLKEDPTIGFPLQGGESSVIIQLPEIEILQSLSFSNEGGSGKVNVATAISRNAVDEGRWQDATFAVFDPEKRSVSLELSGVDARYLKVTWNTSNPGRIHNFGVFGEPRANEYEIKSLAGEDGQAVSVKKQGDEEAAVDYNLLSGYSGARIAYVSSGSGDPSALVDGDSATTYTFSSTDEFPTIIVDLGRSQPINRASALFEQKAAKLAFYSLGELPETTDWVGRTSFDEEALQAFKPLALAADNAGVGRLSLDFQETSGRYLVFQFAPNSPEGADFSVIELAAFTDKLGADHMVARSVWHADAEGGKAPVEEVEEGLSSRSRLLSYQGPLAGYSGASYLSRGSGGLGGGVGSPAFQRAVDEALQAILDELDASDERGGQAITRFVSVRETSPPVFAPVLSVVSRISVSAYTIPGVGHLYYNAGAGEAPPGFRFMAPDFSGEHFGGVIYPEVIGTLTQELQPAPGIINYSAPINPAFLNYPAP